MTIAKSTAGPTPHGSTRKIDSDAVDTSSSPQRQVDLLALEIETDDSGGDPYNRTGQFYLADLKKREQ
jgi:hypothetical protein